VTDLLPAPTTGPLAAAARVPVQPQRLSALDDLVRGFLLSKRSPQTRTAYAADLASWLTFCARLDLDPLAAGIHHADAYLRLLAESGDPAHARLLGARETVIYLADYEQATLVPLPGAGVPDRQELAIEATMAGRAFRRVEVVTSSATGGSHRLWLPLLDGVERLGVVELVLSAEPDAELEEDFRALISLVAELVVVHGAYGDVFTRLGRRRTFSLAAEIQWGLLPPLTFGTERVVITGGLEPAYDIGGDTFDYRRQRRHGRPADPRLRRPWAARGRVGQRRRRRLTATPGAHCSTCPTSPRRSTRRSPASSAPASPPPPPWPAWTWTPGGCAGSTPDIPHH
jgi:hypothetical protein